MTQKLLLFKCKLLCYHANEILASITIRSPSASIQIRGLATEYTTAKWSISASASACYSGWIGVILVLLQYRIVTTKIGWKGLLTQWLMCWILHLEFWFRNLAWSFSCVVWQETFLLNASLSTEKYKWVLANCQQSLMKYRGVTL